MVSLGALATKIFGSSNDRRLKSFNARVAPINALEPQFKALSDDELRGKTNEFRERLANGETVDDLLPEAFATVREAAWRTLGQRHFDMQLVGGMVLHSGRISEMKTGEGKTLVATLPSYLNALSGRGVHVVTVNDYLAKRDSEWMGQIHRFLGLTVGCILHDLDDDQRRQAYGCDITYGTNNEFGFDYLRDNMKYAIEEMVQFGGRAEELQGHNFAIVDEVDSILIDEARTPLIISGAIEDKSGLYQAVDKFIPRLGKEHFELDEKMRTVVFTDDGNQLMEEILEEAGLLKPETALYDVENVTMVHHANQALRAHKLFMRDKDYIVKNGQVVIIDEFTGRMMEGRRYSEGLHQALEAKEGVQVQPENQTLASITFQNYFRLYEQARGHDRHGADRGRRVPGHLQARNARNPDAPADDPHRQRRRGLPDGEGKIQGDHRPDPGLPPKEPAHPGRHHVHREIRNAVRIAEAAQGPASGLERALSRAGS